MGALVGALGADDPKLRGKVALELVRRDDPEGVRALVARVEHGRSGREEVLVLPGAHARGTLARDELVRALVTFARRTDVDEAARPFALGALAQVAALHELVALHLDPELPRPLRDQARAVLTQAGVRPGLRELPSGELVEDWTAPDMSGAAAGERVVEG